MYMDASWLAEFAEPAKDGRNDLFLTPTVPVTASVEIDLGKGAAERGADVRKSPGTLNVTFSIKETRFEKAVVPGLNVKFLKPIFIDWEIAPIVWFEVARSLCIQPVRLLRLTFGGRGLFPINIQLSGAGLAFGEPGLRAEWKKADVVFNIREFMTLFSNAHWEMSESESGSLRSQVDEDDCIEAFFVNSFDPDDLFGGGATFGSGTASSQVISSDDNARNGVDFTHLAHEFGHVLGLRHPDAAATASAVPASTGTLMCPSGFNNDNPRVNSQENEDLLSNPLLRFTLKLRSPGPDCLDSADCGACP